jgi:hypothetical protein
MENSRPKTKIKNDNKENIDPLRAASTNVKKLRDFLNPQLLDNEGNQIENTEKIESKKFFI